MSHRGAPRGGGYRGRGGRGGGGPPTTGAPPGRGAFGNGGPSTFPARGAFGGGDQSGTVFDISGVPSDIQYSELVTLVNKHTPPGFRYIKLTLHGSSARLIVNPSDVSKITGLNGAQVRPGITVQLTQSQSSGTPHHGGRQLTPQQREQLKQLIQSRYDATTQVLSLSGTHSPDNDYNNKSFVYAVMDCIEEVCPGVVSLDLTGNNISQLQALSKLGQKAQQLKNLSLANNAISTFDQIEQLGSGELSDHIQQLMLSGNPFIQNIQQTYNDTTTQTYNYLVESVFPQLTSLDGQTVQHCIEFDVPRVQNNLPVTQPSYFDNEKSQAVVADFVQKYYSVYDASPQDRQKLLPVYGESAVFTICVGQQSGYNNPTIPAEYTQRSHNLHTSNTAVDLQKPAVPATQLVTRGAIGIVYSLSQLPHTQHDMQNFVADTASIQPLNGSIICTLKGQFLENMSELRQFHRVFVLCTPSSEAQNKQWPVTVQHDMLFIGSGKPFQQPQPQQQQQQQQHTQQHGGMQQQHGNGQAEAFFTM